MILSIFSILCMCENDIFSEEFFLPFLLTSEKEAITLFIYLKKVPKPHLYKSIYFGEYEKKN